MAASLDDINAQLAGPLPASSTGNVGVRRRQAAPTVVDTTPDYQREWGATVERTKGYAPTVAGFARQVAGDQQGAAEDYAAAKVRDERAAQLDSDVSTDWRDVGSLGDAFRYARKLAIGSAPDMALSVGAGGVLRMGARRLAADAERRAVMGRISAELSETGATSPLARAAIEKAGERSARAATAQVAERQFGEAVADTARTAVGRNAAAQARIDRAGRAAGFVGATAGQFPGMLSESREQLEKTDQAGAMKIGAADLAASAIGALPTERLVGRLFQTPAAKESLGRQLAMAVPRIAKETGQQALFEGTTEAAQAFVQRAGHKWVDDNVGLLTPEAIQDYVANFVGGAVLGGASGGAVETANHGGAAVRGVAEGVRSGIDHAARGGRWAWDQGGTVREAVRDYLTSKSPFFQRAAEAVAGSPGSPRRQAAAGLGERVSEAARGATEAGKRFYEHLRSRERQDDAEARTDGVMERLDEAMRADVEGGAPMGDLVAGLPTFTQKWAMSHFDPAFLATKSPKAVADMGALLERLATGKQLSRRETELLANLPRLPGSGMTVAKLDAIGAVGPRVADLAKRMSDDAPGASYGTSPLQRSQLETDEGAPRRTARDEAADQMAAGEDATGLDFTDRVQGIVESGRADPELQPLDAMHSARASAERLQQQAAAASDPAERAALQGQIDQLRTDYADLRTKVRAAIERGNGVVTKNDATDASRRFWEQRVASPNYAVLNQTAEIKLNNGKTLIQPQAIDLAMLIRRQQAAIRTEGTASDAIAPRDALLRGLAEAAEVGYSVDPKQLRLGEITDTRTGRVLMRITPAIKAQLANDLQQFKGRVPELSPVPDDAALNRDFARSLPSEDAMGESPVDGGDDPTLFAQGPRSQPPGRNVGTADAEYVPEMGVVSDVNVNDPYAELLTGARRRYAAAGSPRERAAVMGSVAREIATRRLTQELEAGQLSEQTFNQLMAQVENPESGLAERYLARAARGEFASASVRHMPLDNAKPEGFDAFDYTTSPETGDYRIRDRFDEAVERVMARADAVASRAAGRKMHQRPAAPEPRPGPAREVAEQVVKVNTGTRDKIVSAPTAAPAKAKKRIVKKATERLDDTTPAPRKRGKQVIKSVPQAQAAVDATENAGVASATAKTGPHDLKAEKEMLNEVLAQMGVPKLLSLKPLSKTDAKGAPRSPNTGGSYMLRTVQINDTLHGAERVEVLLHETGHHIYAAELAKALGVEPQAVINMDDAQLLDALEKQLPAVAAEYSAWMAERGNAATVPLFQSSAPTYRQRGLAARNGGGAKVTRSTSIHEWMADNIARALAGRRETQSAVGKFFKAIADQLRTFYDTMAGKSPRLAPAKSVEAWVDSLFNRETNAVREATGQAATQVQARAVVAAAVRSEAAPTDPTVPPAPPAAPKPKAGKPKPPKDMDGMMQYVRDFLPPQERKILEQVFKRVQGKLRRVYAKRPDVLEAMASAEHGMEATIAAGYLAWKAGKFKTGSKSGSALLTISEDLHKVVGLAGPGDYAQSILKDMASGRVQAMKQNGHTYDIVKQEARARGQLQQAVNKLGDVKEAIMRPIDRAMAGAGRQMFESGIPAMRKIAGLLYRPAGTTGADRGMVREVVHTTASFAEKANAALQGLSAGEQRRVMRLLQEQAAPEQINAKVSKRVGNKRNVNHGNYRYSKGVRDAVQAVRKLMDDSFKYMESAGVQVGYRKDFFPVLLDIRNENARAQLTALLSDPVYEASIREFFDKPKDTEPKGKGKPKGKPKGKRKAGNVPPLPAEHEAFFEKQRAKLEKRIANGSGNPTQLHNLIAVNMSVVEAMRTGNIATIEKHIAAAEARQERYDVDSDAYKTIDLELRFAKARIKQLSEAGASAEAAAEPSAAEPSAADNTLQGMIKNLVDGAVRGEAASLPSDAAPRFRGASFRLMEFIYRLRDEAVKSGDPEAIAKHNANVKTFASLQTHNPAEVFARYIEPMVRKAEYARRFGHDGEKLEAMLEAMKKQGATEDQVQHAREAVEAAVGTYGQDLSPTLEALSPALAKRFAGRKTRATISGLQAYQNARLLPLSLLSSLVDPMGIAVRSGGDFAVAWTGIRDGMSSITNKASREQLHDMLRLLGSAEDMGSMEALQQGFGGAGNITAAKVNEFVFKWNGMAAWTRTTRYMALLSAHAFMLKHGADATAGKAKAAREDAESPRARSQRYLMELGVQPGDIKTETVTLPSGRTRDQVRLLSAGERAKATAEQLAADDRVRRALMQFVDEAILRPNSQQTPQWHSDPYMGLVTQYKAFGYAIYDQIMGRIDVELSNGNAKVLLAAGAYVPIVVMAEMLRNVAQGDTDDTEDWGPDDWLWLGVERSGLYSPQFGALESAVDDTREGRGPLASQIGPTASQARDLGKVAFGQRSAGKTFESALPGSTLYKKWNDGPAQELE